MENYRNIRLPWSEWKVIKHIGSGGYGKVYEIERNTSGIQEKAALKIISRPKDSGEIDSYYDNGYDRASVVASYEKEIQDYVQEYQIMKEFQGQSNIVSCDDFAVVPHADGIGGDIFLRMELLTSLPQILRQRTLSEQEIIKLGKDISHALMLCESKNIIHRDVKPVNIMVSKFGDYKLGDFGVSKIMDHATYATMMGTPEYQAPEVVHMEKYGKTADIYSLGVTLYWLLNNRKMPFIGADERITPAVKNEAVERRYRGEQLPPPRDGSEELKRIVLKACAYRPQDRYASAEEMKQTLERLESGQIHHVRNYQEVEKDSGGQTYRAENLKVSINKDGTYAGHSFKNGTIGESHQSYSETIGKDGLRAKESSRQTVWEDEGYEEGQTAGNSWGTTSETIGRSGGEVQKNVTDDLFGDIFDDLFGDLFGERSGSDGEHCGIHAPMKGTNLKSCINITFQEAVLGGEKELEVGLKEKCIKCGGSGRVKRIMGNKCPKCSGTGYCLQRKKIEVSIPAGVDEGQSIRIRGKGEPGINGGPWGDLLIELRVGSHPVFQRQGMDIFSTVSMTSTKAAWGGTLRIPVVDGMVEYKVKPGTKSGTCIRLKGKGVPSLRNSNIRGNHYVTLVVQEKY